MFKVMRLRCAECLYGPNKIVSNARRKQLLAKIHKEDSYFICHKATIADTEACCRGHWDQHQGGQAGRIASRLGLVQFVTESDLQRMGEKSRAQATRRKE
jgi:hypothetical protein